MHSDQLLYLIALSQNPSMNVASQKLHLTPSALSISIKNLENELCMQLVLRTTRGVTLTEQGRQVVRIAEDFFGKLEQIQDISIGSRHTAAGKCLIYTVQGVEDDLLPEVIGELYDQYPMIHVTAETAGVSDIIQRLNEAVDDAHELALIYIRRISEGNTNIGKHCTFTPLTTVRLLARIHERFPIAHIKAPSLKSILTYPIVIYNPLSQLPEENPTLKMLTAISRPQKVILESNYQIYQSMIQQGKGIGFDVVSALMFSRPPVLENIHNVLLKDCPRFDLGYLINNQHTLSAPARIFLDTLIGYVERNDFYNG